MYVRTCGGCASGLGLSLYPDVSFDLPNGNGDGGSGSGGGGYWPDPIRTDEEPNIFPDTGGGGGGGAAPAPGAGEEMLGWILGAVISAALISRER